MAFLVVTPRMSRVMTVVSRLQLAMMLASGAGSAMCSIVS